VARQEEDKEDLMREASALAERIELLTELNGTQVVVTAGYRRDGSLSLYFDQDAFFQFTSEGLLRRAWRDGLLYRSQGETLASLYRNRAAGQVVLERTDLTAEELSEFRDTMTAMLTLLSANLNSNSVEVQRVVGDRDGILIEIEKSLKDILSCGETFLSSPLAKRR